MSMSTECGKRQLRHSPNILRGFAQIFAWSNVMSHKGAIEGVTFGLGKRAFLGGRGSKGKGQIRSMSGVASRFDQSKFDQAARFEQPRELFDVRLMSSAWPLASSSVGFQLPRIVRRARLLFPKNLPPPPHPPTQNDGFPLVPPNICKRP